MILIFIAALSLSTQNIATPSNEPELVVIGRKLENWKGKYSIRGSRMKCKTKTSTGDIEIDAIGCSAFETCAAQLEPRIAQSDSSDLDRSARIELKTAIKQDLSSCVMTRRAQLIDALAEQRYQRHQVGRSLPQD